jgi:hypothetical protein
MPADDAATLVRLPKLNTAASFFRLRPGTWLLRRADSTKIGRISRDKAAWLRTADRQIAPPSRRSQWTQLCLLMLPGIGGLAIVKVDPLVRSLRPDPRFAGLFKKLKLQD